jgi:DNA-binding transcriptional ArsR family regulator
MSHKATNWAVEQRGIPPIAKVVLWHLADRHNPDNGCFPDQATLADSVEVSRASVNRHLIELEKAGLIRREQRVDPVTGKQLSTRYRLAFEEGFQPLDVVVRVSDMDTENRVSGTGVAVSQESTEPCLTAETPIEPVIRTGKENQEKNARMREAPTDGLALVGGKVKLHFEDPLFEEIGKIKRQRPPTDRDGYWFFSPDMVARASANISARASPASSAAA